MTIQEIQDRLASMGSEQMRAHNKKYGAGDNQYGVKMGDIRKLAKELKTNHELGLELWETGNIESRFVAMLIMKPKLLTADNLDRMVRSIDFAHVADWFNSYLLKGHAAAPDLRERWMNDSNTWAARSGWSLTAGKVARDASDLDLDALLNRIETEMPNAAPEVQWTMNFALGYAGIHHPEFRERVIAMGEKMGIYRDYPVSKGCTSPFVPLWVAEMVRREG